MGRRLSLLTKSMDEIFDKATIRIIEAKDTAKRNYTLGYVMSNPRKLAWLLFVLDKLEARRDEIAKLEGEARWRLVKSIVSEASKEWRAMSDDQKQKYIEMAKQKVAELSTRLKSIINISRDIEKSVEEAIKDIEAIAEAI